MMRDRPGTMLEKEERLRTLGCVFYELRRNALLAEEVRSTRVNKNGALPFASCHRCPAPTRWLSTHG